MKTLKVQFPDKNNLITINMAKETSDEVSVFFTLVVPQES